MQDELADLQPPAEVMGLGQPDQVFRLTPGLRNGLAYGGQTLGLFMVVVPLLLTTLWWLRGDIGIGLAMLGVFFALMGVVLFYFSEKVHRSPVYALYPEALAFYQDGQWSVLPWDEVRAFKEKEGLAFFPSLALGDGRTVVLRNDYFEAAPFYAAIRRYANSLTRPRRAAGQAAPPREPAPGSLEAMLRPASSPAISVRSLRDELGHVFSSRNPEVRRDLLIAAGLVLLGVLLLFWNGRWILSALRGPTPITLAELHKVKDPADLSNPWVTFQAANAIETDLEMLRKDKYGTTLEARFYLVPIQDRWLIAEMPPNQVGGQFVGYLDTWWAPLRRDAIEAMRARVPDGGQLMPFQMDGVYGYRGQCAALVGLILFFAMGGGAFMFITAWSKDLAQREGKKRAAMADST